MLSSIAVFVQSDYSRDFRPVYRWFISQQDVAGLEDLTPWRAFLLRSTHLPSVLPEIRHGEIWRLITPIFIHLGFLQIFFNLLWLRELGTTVEARQNSLVLLILVLVFAMVSNVAQDLMHGPAFGGMSGVVYALAAYIWMRGKLDPGSGLFLYPATVAMMLIWFFACLIGFEGGMTATTAHVVGLLMGMTWGCLSRRHHRRNSSPKQPIRMI
jgi:GlpG protein